MPSARHDVSHQREPRPGTRRRELWDRLHAVAPGWVEFHFTEYAPTQATLCKISSAFRDDYGLDLECGGSSGALCRWRVRS